MTNDDFNFDVVPNRRGTACYKWDDVADGVLPLWVADMDFPAAPCIVETLEERVKHGVFGYVKVPDSYYDAVIDWFERRHGWTMQRDWIIYTSGVVPAVSAIIKAVAKPGEKVLVQTPVYNCFFSSIRNNGCELVENELLFADGTYTVDFADFEQKVADPAVKVFLLCNPHNPAGRVWTAAELRRMGELCLKHGVFVVADEIHCEIVSPGFTFTSYGTLPTQFLQNAAICTSPSKAFNIAGLQIANITVPDADYRRKIDKAININEVCDVNAFGVVALQAAYNGGEQWLEAVNAYIHANYKVLCSFVKEQMPGVEVCRLEGTYLAWLHLCGFPPSSDVAKCLENEYGLRVSPGFIYGRTAGRDFLRLNLACPKAVLEEALARLKRGLDSMAGSYSQESC